MEWFCELFVRVGKGSRDAEGLGSLGRVRILHCQFTGCAPIGGICSSQAVLKVIM